MAHVAFRTTDGITGRLVGLIAMLMAIRVNVSGPETNQFRWKIQKNQVSRTLIVGSGGLKT
jgi:hypothetical protein